MPPLSVARLLLVHWRLLADRLCGGVPLILQAVMTAGARNR